MASGADETERVRLTSASLGPSDCEVHEPLDVNLAFTVLDEDVALGFWAFSYVLDTVEKRLIIQLGCSEPKPYPKGETHEVAFHVDEIDVSGISPAHLCNAGLLVASFRSGSPGKRVDDDGNAVDPGGEQILDANFVISVAKQKEKREDGTKVKKYIRNIFNPLDT